MRNDIINASNAVHEVSGAVVDRLATPECPDSGIPAGSVPRDSARSPNALRGLTIVLPCFNEAENVADAIRYATQAAERCSIDHEIVVVDDGSSDDTSTIAATFVERDRHVRLIVHPQNLGYGDALRSGIAAASMPWVLLTDADLQFDLREIEDFLPYTQRADLILGWRILRQDPLHRRVNAAAWNWLVRRSFHLRVRDIDCAFKLIRRDLLQSCQLSATGAMISTELLVKCRAAGGRMEEVGVHHRARVAGEQSGANPRVVARAFRELATLRRALRREPSPAGL
ncbi:MAG: glycosyltransferase family 2 protein [Solirubrobacterales bacterium]|nr:glycosyltransferase family 2 protein [Solirubrobacterales bacterium]